MITNKEHNKIIITAILFLLCSSVYGQFSLAKYRVDVTNSSSGLNCNLTAVFLEPDKFYIEVLDDGISPIGYEVVENNSPPIEPGCPGTNNTRTVALTPNAALCGTYNELLLACCSYRMDDFRIIPNTNFILTPDPGINNTVPIVTLEAVANFDSLVYQWQYFHPVTNTWTLLPPQFIGQSTINVTVLDLANDSVGFSVEDFLNVSIQFRLEMCNGWIPPGFPYTYVFITQSPEVLSHTVQNETCIYSSDGSFTLTFDRPLNTSEVIENINLDWAGTDNIFGTADDFDNYLSLPNGSIYSGTTYTWTGLDNGVYRINYQSAGAASLEQYGLITIGSVSSAVDFTAVKTDVSCFNANNGSLEITASGGIGNYQYKLNTNTWANFSSGNIHTINGLGPDIYNVQVRDGNQCEAQQ